MKFPTFMAAFLLAVVALSISTVSAATERTHENVDRTRPGETEEPTSPRDEEQPGRETEDEEEEPQGGIVYSKNGLMVYVDENGDTTVVTVSINGNLASKVTYTGSGDSNTGGNDGSNNGGDDAEPGEDGQDGEDGNDSGEDPDDGADDTPDRTDRPAHTR